MLRLAILARMFSSTKLCAGNIPRCISYSRSSSQNNPLPQKCRSWRLAFLQTTLKTPLPAVAPAASLATDAAPDSTSHAPPPPPPPLTTVLEPGLSWPRRTHGCGTLRASDADADAEVTLCGWVDRHRNLGGVLFLDIRDHTGITQVVVDPQTQPDIAAKAERLRSEWVVAISGRARRRKDRNPRLPTGEVEIAATHVRVLNAVGKPLPFAISTTEETAAEQPREELRLRHRVLDLRRPAMSTNLRLRHALVRSMRRYLEDAHEFVEVETPILTRSTPEGARDYLVPSRLQAGDWYALPQSPQLFKQMLMIAGYDRYYQVSA
jgi:aspartyl-tRNA synthetase